MFSLNFGKRIEGFKELRVVGQDTIKQLVKIGRFFVMGECEHVTEYLHLFSDLSERRKMKIKCSLPYGHTTSHMSLVDNPEGGNLLIATWNYAHSPDVRAFPGLGSTWMELMKRTEEAIVKIVL